MSTYLNKDKGLRLLAYGIDIAVLLMLCLLIFPLFGLVDPQSIISQINLVHNTSEVSLLQMETLNLMSLFEDFTIAFASLGCIYEIIFLQIFHTTIGKFLCGLKLIEDSSSSMNGFLRIVLRSIVKALMIAFLGSILIVFSGFSIIASPNQISIQDRIGKTRIINRKD